MIFSGAGVWRCQPGCARWHGDSYLTSLYVEPGSAIKSGVDGKTFKLYVNGVQRRLLKGALYTGEVALKLE
jgi:hypothetical protein